MADAKLNKKPRNTSNTAVPTVVSTEPEVSALNLNYRGRGVLEVRAYNTDPPSTGVFSYVEERHGNVHDERQYTVRIYNPLAALLTENVKQRLAALSFHVLSLGNQADCAMENGETLGLPDDVIVWHNMKEGILVWFTVATARSFFLDEYETLFGQIERLAWGETKLRDGAQ